MARKNQNAESRKPEILEAYYQVLIEEGFEGCSIGKIAERLNMHPTLILHYFKNKENLQIALIDLMIAKYKSVNMLNFEKISNHAEQFQAVMDVIFSFTWSRTVDPGVHFGFYYKSFRDERISALICDMFKWLRNFLYEKFKTFNDEGIINVADPLNAADFVVTLMEGLEFHTHFLADGKNFDEFAESAKNVAIYALKHKAI